MNTENKAYYLGMYFSYAYVEIHFFKNEKLFTKSLVLSVTVSVIYLSESRGRKLLRLQFFAPLSYVTAELPTPNPTIQHYILHL